MSDAPNWEKTQLLVEPDGSARMFHRRRLPCWFKDGIRQHLAKEGDDYQAMHADGYVVHQVWILVENTHHD